MVEILAQDGIRLFWDTDLLPGDSLMSDLEVALENSSAPLVFFGKDSPDSASQLNEIAYALERLTADATFRVIPVLLPESEPDEMPSVLTALQWVDLRDAVISRESLLPVAHVLGFSPRRSPIGAERGPAVVEPSRNPVLLSLSCRQTLSTYRADGGWLHMGLLRRGASW